MRPHEIKNIIKVGFFVTAMTSVLMIFILLIGKESSLFDQKVNLNTVVSNAQNLKVGSFVQLKGIKIGTVEKIFVKNVNEVVISLRINAEFLKWIKEDSYASISTAGLVGDKFLEILGGTESSQSLKKGGTIRSEDYGSVQKILGKGENIMSRLESIAGKVDAALGDEQSIQKLNQSLQRLDQITRSLEKISKEVEGGQLKGTLKSFNNILSRIESGPGTLHSLVYDDVLHEDLRNLLGGASRNKVIKYFIRQSIEKSEKKSK